MAETLRFNAREIIPEMSVRIKIVGFRRLRFRVWLCNQLIRLAGVVGGVKIEVENLHEKPKAHSYSE